MRWEGTYALFIVDFFNRDISNNIIMFGLQINGNKQFVNNKSLIKNIWYFFTIHKIMLCLSVFLNSIKAEMNLYRYKYS